jgi:diacylglycerol kinase family enzyme
MSGDLLVLAAGQARQMGRMLNVCPDALLDDGLLDFTVLFGSPGKQVRLALYYSICHEHTFSSLPFLFQA